MTALPDEGIGRAAELTALRSRLDRARTEGGALVISGEPGVGKSFLLRALQYTAAAQDWNILSTEGAETETELTFAGLHRLLTPVLPRLASLPEPQRNALESAFGLSDQSAPDFFLVALAVLTLITDVAADGPVLLLVEDGHWLDRLTTDVLAFLGRRLAADPVLLAVAVRNGFDLPFVAAGFEELEVAGLADRDARALLAATAPHVQEEMRDRVLNAAAGNPLALMELPIAMSLDRRSAGLTNVHDLPLTTRLERAFASRVADLPQPTQDLLLVAAVSDGVASEAVAAANVLRPGEVSDLTWEPAVAAGLIASVGTDVQFRHPLVRSAIRLRAAKPQLRAAHLALAQVLTADPDRSVWHRAAAATFYDADLAADLERAADRALRRGSLTGAMLALERAAELSPDPEARGRRWVTASEFALELGRLDVVDRLIGRAGQLALEPRETGRLAWLRLAREPDVRTKPVAIRAVIQAADQAAAAGDVDFALKVLLAVSLDTFWTEDPDTQAWRQELLAVCDRLPVPEDDPRLLATLGYAACIDRADHVMDVASRWEPREPLTSGAVFTVALALCILGAYDLAEGQLSLATELMRREGRLRQLAQVLVVRAMGGILNGRWSSAWADLEESAMISSETVQPMWQAGAYSLRSMIAAVQGQTDEAMHLAAEGARIGTEIGSASPLLFVQLGRGLSALSVGRSQEAYEELSRLFDPSDASHHTLWSAFAIGDLADAAVASGQVDDARRILRGVEGLAHHPSPWLRVVLARARAVLADDAQAEALYRQGLAQDLNHWPFDRARLQLAFGVWLRRQRRGAEARQPLRAARDTFEALGAEPWLDRARQELRASGETSRSSREDARARLSPQELQIARMAADGLSNRQIGERLFLSHRTVGSHLYRIFPKLEISSRMQLRQVMESGGLDAAGVDAPDST